MSLKRFKQGRSAYSGNNLREKIETYVDFPIEGLDLAPYCCDTTKTSGTGSNSGSGKQQPPSSGSDSPTITATETATKGDISGDGSSSPPSSSSSLHENDHDYDHDNNGIDSSLNVDRTLYDLFAVCNHFGRMGFGHYTAFARDWMDMYTTDNNANPTSSSSSSSGDGDGGGGWYKYDDEDVTAVRNPEGEIKTPAAYILFYRRRPANHPPS